MVCNRWEFFKKSIKQSKSVLKRFFRILISPNKKLESHSKERITVKMDMMNAIYDTNEWRGGRKWGYIMIDPWLEVKIGVLREACMQISVPQSNSSYRKS